MASASRVSEESQRTLRVFGYEWSPESRTWVNRKAGRAIGEETILAWPLDQLRAWLTKDAYERQ